MKSDSTLTHKDRSDSCKFKYSYNTAHIQISRSEKSKEKKEEELNHLLENETILQRVDLLY